MDEALLPDETLLGEETLLTGDLLGDFLGDLLGDFLVLWDLPSCALEIHPYPTVGVQYTFIPGPHFLAAVDLPADLLGDLLAGDLLLDDLLAGERLLYEAIRIL